MRKVAVFFGGRSSEREISVLTGVFVLNVLKGAGYDLLPVYVGEDGLTYTSPKMYDVDVFRKKVAFTRIFFDGGKCYAWDKRGKRTKGLGKVDGALNCCHGGWGEGGGVSGLAWAQEIPFASPDLSSSGVFMDKILTKLVAKGLGIPVVDYVRVGEREYRQRGKFLHKTVEIRLKYPVVVKPARQGSSIGVSLARNEEELKKALETAFTLDAVALVEKFVQGRRDVNCAAYKLQGEIILSEAEVADGGEGVYDFAKKYLKEGGEFLKGGGRVTLKGKEREKIRTYTKQIYKRLDLTGVVRVDYLVGVDGGIYLSEVNGVPGNLAYYLFCEKITDARAFFIDLLEEGMKPKEKKNAPSTGVLTKLNLRK